MAILRWLGVIPGAILGAWLAFFLARIVATLGMWFYSDSALHDFTVETMSNFPLGLGFVYFGTVVAPSRKLRTAYVLALLLACTVVALAVRSWWPGGLVFAGEVSIVVGCACAAIFATFDISGFEWAWLAQRRWFGP